MIEQQLAQLQQFRAGQKVMAYKWKNHFSEMKGDVGMSLHEKEGEQEDT